MGKQKPASRRSPRFSPVTANVATAGANRAATAVARVAASVATRQAAAIAKAAAAAQETTAAVKATLATEVQRPTRSSRGTVPSTVSGPEWTIDIRRQSKPKTGPRGAGASEAAPASSGPAASSLGSAGAVAVDVESAGTPETIKPVDEANVASASSGPAAATLSPVETVATAVESADTPGLGKPVNAAKAMSVGSGSAAATLGSAARGPYQPLRADNHVVSAIAFAQEAIGVARDQAAPRPLIASSNLARIAVLLPDADTAALGNLPEEFMGYGEAIEQILSAGKPGRAETIQLRFTDFIEREQAAFASQRSDKMKLGTSSNFRLADDAAVIFFNEQGVKHGSRTHNHQCGHAGCVDQKCCPLEYNFSTVETYADRLAADALFEEHAHVFSNKLFKKHVRDGVKRQQTDGRHPLPAPPVLLPHAECIAHEGYSAVQQSFDSFYGPEVSLKEQGQHAWQACRDAQHLAVMATDLGTGKRTADITSSLTKDFYRTGSKPGRKFTVCHRTSKITLPVHPWCVREMPDSVLCPVAAIEHYLATCREFGVHIGPVSNGQDGKTPCSPFLFPFITKDPATGFPVVTDNRAMRNGAQGSRWEKVSTSQCNAWLKRMLERLDGTIITDYTIHGCRVVAALVALASGQTVESINKIHGWREKSEMVRSYARLVQLQSMTQEPVLRDTLASTLLQNYQQFFK